MEIYKIDFPPNDTFLHLILCFDGAPVPKHLFPSKSDAQIWANKICESIRFETFFQMELAIKPLNNIIDAPPLPNRIEMLKPIPIDYPCTAPIESNPFDKFMAPAHRSDLRHNATNHATMLLEMRDAYIRYTTVHWTKRNYDKYMYRNDTFRKNTR
eukprot:928487_1